MKVKEAREKMDSLKQLYDNAIKIQNCCLNDKAAVEAIMDLEESQE